MNGERPNDIKEYRDWMLKRHHVKVSPKLETYYKSTLDKVKRDFESSEFWIQLTRNLHEYHDEYLVTTKYPLLASRDNQPVILTKAFDSFLLKSYRRNVLANKNWPDEPEDGWVLPENWYSRINDSIRTLIEVKYLDGVEFLINKIKGFCEQHNTECSFSLEAREEGYYAAHLYIRQIFEIPRINWDTVNVDFSIEIQITTQLQEVIRKLLHKYYEDARKRAKDVQNIKWQWNYRSEEFAANYLGHILHYVEGMIMEIREKQKAKETP